MLQRDVFDALARCTRYSCKVYSIPYRGSLDAKARFTRYRSEMYSIQQRGGLDTMVRWTRYSSEVDSIQKRGVPDTTLCNQIYQRLAVILLTHCRCFSFGVFRFSKDQERCPSPWTFQGLGTVSSHWSFKGLGTVSITLDFPRTRNGVHHTFPLEDCSEFGNFVITHIGQHKNQERCPSH